MTQWITCEHCSRKFFESSVDSPNHCPRCGRPAMALYVTTIEQFIRNNYPKYRLITKLEKGVRTVVFECEDCHSHLEMNSLDYLGISPDTYCNALLRRTFERHSIECDGTLRVSVKPGKVEVNTNDRKIVLE